MPISSPRSAPPTPSAAAELVSPDSSALESTLNNCYARLSINITDRLHAQGRNVTQLRKRLPRPTHLVQNMMQRTDDLVIRLKLALDNGIELRRVRLNRLAGILKSSTPQQSLAGYRTKCSGLEKRLQNHFRHRLQAWEKQLDYLSRSLKTVSPLATLERGYAIVTDEDDNVVRRAGQLRENTEISTRFSRGRVQSTVKQVTPDGA